MLWKATLKFILVTKLKIIFSAESWLLFTRRWRSVNRKSAPRRSWLTSRSGSTTASSSWISSSWSTPPQTSSSTSPLVRISREVWPNISSEKLELLWPNRWMWGQSDENNDPSIISWIPAIRMAQCRLRWLIELSQKNDFTNHFVFPVPIHACCSRVQTENIIYLNVTNLINSQRNYFFIP